MSRVDAIDALLPQTQCGECGYAGCRPYASALAEGAAPIGNCPPGGIETVEALAELLNIDATPFRHNAILNQRAPSVAIIREAECIGCTKCIQACPVDAIIGSAKQMHSILSHECTGCGLCVEPCPVDCIEMESVAEATYNKALARTRYQNRQIRHLRTLQEKEKIYQEKRRIVSQSPDKQKEKTAKQAYILQAIERVQSKKKECTHPTVSFKKNHE